MSHMLPSSSFPLSTSVENDESRASRRVPQIQQQSKLINEDTKDQPNTMSLLRKQFDNEFLATLPPTAPLLQTQGPKDGAPTPPSLASFRLDAEFSAFLNKKRSEDNDFDDMETILLYKQHVITAWEEALDKYDTEEWKGIPLDNPAVRSKRFDQLDNRRKEINDFYNHLQEHRRASIKRKSQPKKTVPPPKCPMLEKSKKEIKEIEDFLASLPPPKEWQPSDGPIWRHFRRDRELAIFIKKKKSEDVDYDDWTVRDMYKRHVCKLRRQAVDEYYAKQKKSLPPVDVKEA